MLIITHNYKCKCIEKLDLPKGAINIPSNAAKSCYITCIQNPNTFSECYDSCIRYSPFY